LNLVYYKRLTITRCFSGRSFLITITS
jgi:hypothetical protein